MDKSGKCDVSKTHISSNCRKVDTSDVKGRILTKINKCSFEKTLSLKSAIHSRIKVTNFSKIWQHCVEQ